MTFVIAAMAGLLFLHVFAGLWRSISLRNLVDIAQDDVNLKREEVALLRHQLWGDKLENDVREEFRRSREKTNA